MPILNSAWLTVLIASSACRLSAILSFLKMIIVIQDLTATGHQAFEFEDFIELARFAIYFDYSHISRVDIYVQSVLYV